VRKDGALGDNGIRVVSDVNTLRIEMSRVLVARRGVVEKEDGDEADRRFGDVEGIMEDEFATLALEYNGAYPDSVDGEAT
jgi:hypothetical protein